MGGEAAPHPRPGHARPARGARPGPRPARTPPCARRARRGVGGGGGHRVGKGELGDEAVVAVGCAAMASQQEAVQDPGADQAASSTVESAPQANPVQAPELVGEILDPWVETALV